MMSHGQVDGIWTGKCVAIKLQQNGILHVTRALFPPNIVAFRPNILVSVFSKKQTVSSVTVSNNLWNVIRRLTSNIHVVTTFRMNGWMSS
ncbi:hypothetical protein HUJ04_009647 [Dendroctonus ponderosae]|nr:hypothetical protein HUJ04_009647 [Dendroctonus ponderosae]